MTLTADDRALLIRRARNRDSVEYSDLTATMRRITPADLEPYRADLERFTAIPFPDHPATGGATWANVQRNLFANPGSIFQYDAGIPSFFAWLEDQASAVPSGDTVTDPLIVAFVTAYSNLPDVSPIGHVGHGYTDDGYSTATPHDAQQTWLAMPLIIREQWHDLYHQAIEAGSGAVNLAGVLWPQALEQPFGYSTENFFRWCRNQGVTTTDGTPVAVVTTPHSQPTDPTRDITYWNGLVRTGQWEPYLDDLIRFIPEPASQHTGWNGDTVRCILGLPYGTRDRVEAQRGGWLQDDVDATPGSHRIHEFLGHFARAVVEGRFTLSTTTTPEAPITTDMPVLTTAELGQPVYEWPRAVRVAAQHEIARYLFENQIGPSGTLEAALENSNGALFFEGRDSDYWSRQEFGPHTRFRNAVLDGSFVTTLTAVPSGDSTTPEPPAFDFDITVAAFGERRYEILSHVPVSTVRTYMDYERARDSTIESFLINHFLDPHEDEARWNHIGPHVRERHDQQFLNWARENRALFTPTPVTTPEATTTDTPDRIIPIGPEHPEWHAFAERLAAEATRAGMCPEYDRIARAVGLPTRKERVTYRITLEVPLNVERGENADIRALREAARTALDTATSSGGRRFEVERTQTVS